MSNSRDVVFAFFGTAWSGAVNRDFVMPEDRLAAALLEHPDVPRVARVQPVPQHRRQNARRPRARAYP